MLPVRPQAVQCSTSKTMTWSIIFETIQIPRQLSRRRRPTLMLMISAMSWDVVLKESPITQWNALMVIQILFLRKLPDQKLLIFFNTVEICLPTFQQSFAHFDISTSGSYFQSQSVKRVYFIKEIDFFFRTPFKTSCKFSNLLLYFFFSSKWYHTNLSWSHFCYLFGFCLISIQISIHCDIYL